jgi:hypothetical protein
MTGTITRRLFGPLNETSAQSLCEQKKITKPDTKNSVKHMRILQRKN